ncbi:hypothetical protein [Aquabacterium sp. OR-4]|uniref:hypothetical protein n=1 Tax=Aquabacterium sp. OR-4 TaxID=2978127 RepID=UPI0021B496C7|nr:hypothetical protein [Aquabacterium sp. OR-4]MDT7834331.1 hypothetical protein [Aquabacterium sp. OR-4]
MLINLFLALPALALALALRPWRAVGQGGPPWPWLAWCATLPLLWAADHLARAPIVQPLSGASLLVLLAGWPLAMLALLPVALLMTLAGDLPWHEGLHRLVWLGVVPGTLALLLGAALRRWLPGHLFIYILGRGFFTTWIAAALAGALALALTGAPQGTEPADLLIGRFLSASGEAFLTGMFAAIFVAFRPHWLATYSDRLYLPKD